jgi:hypothetical protein
MCVVLRAWRRFSRERIVLNHSHDTAGCKTGAYIYISGFFSETFMAWVSRRRSRSAARCNIGRRSDCLREGYFHSATNYAGPAIDQEHERNLWCLDDLALIPHCKADNMLQVELRHLEAFFEISRYMQGLPC